MQNLALDPNALNALHGFDLSVVDGKIGKLKMSIPWRNLLHERTKIYLENARFSRIYFFRGYSSIIPFHMTFKIHEVQHDEAIRACFEAYVLREVRNESRCIFECGAVSLRKAKAFRCTSLFVQLVAAATKPRAPRRSCSWLLFPDLSPSFFTTSIGAFRVDGGGISKR